MRKFSQENQNFLTNFHNRTSHRFKYTVAQIGLDVCDNFNHALIISSLKAGEQAN